MERKGAPQDLNQAATLTGWATPRVTTNGGHPSPQCTGKGSRIEDQAAMMEMAGWPTPMAGSPGTDEYNPAGNTDSSRKTVALLMGWPTPAANDGNGGKGIPRGMNSTGKMPNGSKTTVGLSAAAKMLAGWTTPTAHDTSPRGKGQKLKHGTKHGCADLNADAILAGPAPFGFTADPNPTTPTDVGARFSGQLNPCLSRWLQGLPVIWDVASFRVVKQSSRRSSKKAATE